MIEFIARAGARGDEELFGSRKQDGRRVVLTARAVRDEMKDIATRYRLPTNYFSAHSLRKGSITHMRAQGATEDDCRDRGNYAAGSQVMNTTYDCATGLRPLASNNLEGGHEPMLTDVNRRAVGRSEHRP
jgi:integrase